MSTRVVLVCTAFGLATVSAAYEAGLLTVDGPQVLVVSANTTVLENATPLTAVDGMAALSRRFDAVHDLNEAIAPQHPRRWLPAEIDLPAWKRDLRRLWALGDDDVTLLTESVAGEPAHALARVFDEAALEVYADGLMSYGPTGGRVAGQVGGRLRQLLHLDLVPGLVPLLHREWGTPSVVVPADSLRMVVRRGLDESHAWADGERSTRTALVLGQYLAADGLLGAAEELDLYAEMVRRCADLGHDRVVFKQHPSAPPTQGLQLAERLAQQSRPVAGFAVARRAELAEAWFARRDADLVVGCFSTALLTAATGYGLPVARLGTEVALRRMSPLANLNRIPALLVDETVPDLATQPPGPARVPDDLQDLVDAVAHAMQPDLLALATGSGPAPA